MPDITDENWTLDTNTRVGTNGQIINSQYGVRRWYPGGVGGNAEDHGLGAFTSDTLLFVGYGGDRHSTGEGLARLRLASQAPLMFRMLVRVIQSGGKISPDLEAGIRANLHLISPGAYPLPDEPQERRTGWQHITNEIL